MSLCVCALSVCVGVGVCVIVGACVCVCVVGCVGAHSLFACVCVCAYVWLVVSCHVTHSVCFVCLFVRVSVSLPMYCLQLCLFLLCMGVDVCLNERVHVSMCNWCAPEDPDTHTLSQTETPPQSSCQPSLHLSVFHIYTLPLFVCFHFSLSLHFSHTNTHNSSLSLSFSFSALAPSWLSAPNKPTVALTVQFPRLLLPPDMTSLYNIRFYV